MARPLRILYEGAFYHVISRGNDRHPIVRDDEDREAFAAILTDSLERYGVILHAYCLLTNHFHLLVETPGANLPEFIRRLKITYASAYNRRHRRVGHLFQGPYHAFNVDRDESLAAVSRYIHLNPARTSSASRMTRAKRLASLKAYRWSSLPTYLDANARRTPPIHTDLVLAEYGADPESAGGFYWKDLVEDLDQARLTPDEAVGGTVIGSPRFVAVMNERIAHVDGKERPAVRRIHSAVHTDRVVEAVCRVVAMTPEELLAARGLPRHLLMDALLRHARLRNCELAQLLGVSESTVSVGIKRMLSTANTHPQIRDLMDEIDRTLGAA